MTELTFLVELLLNHRLQKSTKDLIAARIGEVQEEFSRTAPELSRHQRPIVAQSNPAFANQAPSMQAIMARNPDLSGAIQVPDAYNTITVATAPEPVAVIAQTPAAVAALNSRQQAINEAMSGKANASGGKRKF